MNFIENVKSGVSAAVGTLSDAAQNLIEKNRVNARINRLKLVIKNESSILNKAYIQLGKYYFENPDEPKKDDVESLFEIISNSKARLKMAQDIYRSIIQKQNEEAVAESAAEPEDFVDTITVACSNEEDYGETSQQTAKEAVSKAAEAAEDIAEEAVKATENAAEDIAQSAHEAAKDFSETAERIAQEAAYEAEAADDESEAF